MLLNKLFDAVRDQFADDPKCPGIELSIDSNGNPLVIVYRYDGITRKPVIWVNNPKLDDALIQAAKDFLLLYYLPPTRSAIQELGDFVSQNCATTSDPW